MSCRILVYVDKNNISNTDKLISSIMNCQDNYAITIADDVNDLSFSEKLIESLGDIAGDNVSYIQNDENLGFGATINSVIASDRLCDWLVTCANTSINRNDVEFLSKAVQRSENNLMAVPRTNKGMLATFPYTDYRFKRENTSEESKTLFEAVNQVLPDITVIPYVSAFCVYIKASCILRAGDLPVNAQTADLCMAVYCQNVQNAGGRCVMCNHLFIENNTDLDENLEDYPQLSSITSLYEKSYQDTSDYFSSLLVPKKSKKLKVLYFMLSVTDMYNGTSEHALSLLEQLTAKFDDKYEFTVLATKKAIEFHDIKEKYSNVVEPEQLKGVFDLGFCPFMFYDIKHQIMISSHCLKIVGWNLDMIMYRCNYLFAKQNYIESNYKLSDMMVDGYITNSQSVSNDMKELIGIDELIKDKPVVPILLAVNEQKYDTEEEVPFKDYILVMGNSFKHKAISGVMPYLEKCGHNFIVFGAEQTGAIRNNIYGYRSGYLSNEFVYYLYNHCEGLLFPSVYEGFGLPIIRALNMGKEVIVNDNFLNREIMSYFSGTADHIHTYRRFSEIPELVDKLHSGFENDLVNRNWRDVAVDVDRFFDVIMERQTDAESLAYRNDNYTVFEEITDSLDALNARMDVYTKIQNLVTQELNNSNKSDSEKLKLVAEVINMVCGG